MSDILDTRLPSPKIWQKTGPIEMAEPEGNCIDIGVFTKFIYA